MTKASRKIQHSYNSDLDLDLNSSQLSPKKQNKNLSRHVIAIRDTKKKKSFSSIFVDVDLSRVPTVKWFGKKSMSEFFFGSMQIRMDHWV